MSAIVLAVAAVVVSVLVAGWPQAGPRPEGTAAPAAGPVLAPAVAVVPERPPGSPRMPAQPPPDQPLPPVAPLQPGAPVAPQSSTCGMFDVAGCISEAFTGLLQAAVTDAINPALELLSDTLLQTPRPSAVPRLAQLWEVSWRISLALYGAVVLVGGLVVMAHQSVQTRYGVREIGPRLAVGFLAGWLTLPLADMAVQIANAVSGAVVGPIDQQAGVAGLAALVRASIAAPAVGGLPWPLLLAWAALGAVLVAVLAGYVLRVLGVIVLVAAGPLVVMWHALPQTDPVARWWWRALAGLLAIQIIQALVISVGLVILLPPPGSPPGQAGPGGAAAGAGVLGFPPDGGGWVTLLVLGALLWLLLRVPGWVWSSVKLNAGGSSVLGTAVKAVIAYKTGGLIRSALAANSRSRRTGPAGRAGSAGRTERPEPDGDPYERAPTFAGGQMGLPFPGLTPRRPRAAARPTTPPRGLAAIPQPGRGQYELPLDEGLWPEHRPVEGRDGQWRLPLQVPRVPPPPRAARPAPTVATFGGRQTALDFRVRDPYAGNRRLSSGQYPLPLPGLRRHRAAAAPSAPAAPPAPSVQRRAEQGVQLQLPIPSAPRPPRPVTARPVPPATSTRAPSAQASTPPASPPVPSTRPGPRAATPPIPPVAPRRSAPNPTPAPGPEPARPDPAVEPPDATPPPRTPPTSATPPSAGRRPRRAPQLPRRNKP